MRSLERAVGWPRRGLDVLRSCAGLPRCQRELQLQLWVLLGGGEVQVSTTLDLGRKRSRLAFAASLCRPCELSLPPSRAPEQQHHSAGTVPFHPLPPLPPRVSLAENSSRKAASSHTAK